MTDRDSRQIEHEAAAWLARRDGGTWDRDEAARFDAWIAASIAHRVAFVRLEAAWAASGRLKALGAGVRAGTVPPRGEWRGEQRGKGHGAPAARAAPSARPHRRMALAGGAVAALLVLAGGLGWGWREFVATEATSYATAAGEMRTVPLADGSAVTLSSGSAIEVRLSRRERHIDLRRGEAFFAVAHDGTRPFDVSVGARRAVAVGTRFAVRRDPEEMRVIVTEGLVRLEAQAVPDGSPAPSALLPAGSVATARASSVLVRTGSVGDAERLLTWRSGYLVFHDTSLENAVAEFNRYGAQRLVIGDAAVGLIRIGGNFRWANSEAFVRLLEDGFGIRAERHADRIVLHSRKDS